MARPVVGVDIDGVLGNQVYGVLDRINTRLGLSLNYEDVVHWDVPLGDTSFVPEIARAMMDPTFVLNMPVHEGAKDMLLQLREHYYVRIITVRPPETMVLTMRWLTSNALPYDDLVPAREARKSLHEVDVLIDDYVGNLAEFLRNAPGVGILVDQPWNQDTGDLEAWQDDPRLVRIEGLVDVPPLLHEMLQ
jgi:5'(3')-deoxyribonucleotidase